MIKVNAIQWLKPHHDRHYHQGIKEQHKLHQQR